MDIPEKTSKEILENLYELLKILEKEKKERGEYERNFPKFYPKFGERKNSQLHIMMETSVFEGLRNEAKSKGYRLSEYCRMRLRGEF